VNQEYAYGMWVIVAFNIGLFLFFIISFLIPKGRAEWRNMGIITAFLVALFTEMYGFPLTVYLLSGWLGDAYPVLQPYNHKFGHLWVVVFGGSTFAWAVVMALSLVFLIAGYTLMSKGWKQVHSAHGKLVTDGVYGFVRHPQYSGLFLVIMGFLIQWPTFITVIMTPVLVYAYVRLSRSEERVVKEHFREEYEVYAKNKPMFFPSMSQWKEFLMVPIREENEFKNDS